MKKVKYQICKKNEVGSDGWIYIWYGKQTDKIYVGIMGKNTMEEIVISIKEFAKTLPNGMVAMIYKTHEGEVFVSLINDIHEEDVNRKTKVSRVLKNGYRSVRKQVLGKYFPEY